MGPQEPLVRALRLGLIVLAVAIGREVVAQGCLGDPAKDQTWGGYALVVGINQYPRPQQLRNAVPDAQAVADYLSTSGFCVTTFLDAAATRSAILSFLQETLPPHLNGNDRFVFFFAGHGHTVERSGQEFGYIVPYGSDARNVTSLISMGNLLESSRHLEGAKHQLFILASCFGGLLGEMQRGGRGVILIDDDRSHDEGYLSVTLGKTVRQYLTAGGKDDRVPDGSGNLSLFTEELLRGLESKAADADGDGCIYFREISLFLEKGAATFSSRPISGELLNHRGGDFVFFDPQAGCIPLPPQPSVETRVVALIEHPAKLAGADFTLDGQWLVPLARTAVWALVEIPFPRGVKSRVLTLGGACPYPVSEGTDFTRPIDICLESGRRGEWWFGGGPSLFDLQPDLPAQLTTHQNHPDDLALLSGDAGTTDLDRMTVQFLNLSAGRKFQLGRRGNLGLQLGYTLKLPLSIDGRRAKQQENDPRPAREGSFIFTEAEKVEPVHELGLGFTREGQSGARIAIRPMLYVGYWRMTFAKGWDRFGSDQAALVWEGKGVSISPQLHIGAQFGRFTATLGLAFYSLSLDYEDGRGGKSEGWEVQLSLHTGWGT